MTLKATSATVSEFRETHQLLIEQLEQLAELTKHYPVVCTFAGQRFVFERKADIESLINELKHAVDEYQQAA